MDRKLAAVAALAFCCAFAGARLLLGGRAGEKRELPHAPKAHAPTGQDPIAEGGEVPPPAVGTALKPAAAKAQEELARQPIVGSPATALVLDAEREPIDGAEVSRTRVEAYLPASLWGWDEIDRAWWIGASEVTRTDAGGRFGAEAVAGDDPAFGSQLWISQPGQLAAYEVLPPAADLAGREFVLQAAEELVVRVLDASGAPVAGAVVEQHGVELAGVSIHDVPPHAALLFQRAAETSAEGEVRLAAFPGVQAVRARTGELVSRPHLVERDATSVTLTVGAAFVAAGTVTRPPAPPDVAGEIIPRVTILALQGNLWRELGSSAARGGDWGPLMLPVLDFALYRARLHGVGVVPTSLEFPPPQPGDRVTLHLEARTGETQWYRVLDEEGNPLSEATVRASWVENGLEEGVLGHARPDGYVCVLGVRPGVIRSSAACPGYATLTAGTREIPTPMPVTLEIRLPRAGAVRGRVTLAGEPVTDFEITYWPSTDLPRKATRVFSDRADGRFELADVRRGSFGMVAASRDSPGSEPLQIEVEENGAEVELELRPAIPGHGRVVAAGSGETVPGTLVRPHVLGSLGPANPWGPPLSVDVDGAFRGVAFRNGENFILAEAPGFGTVPVFASAVGGEVDFGVIELAPRVDLEVEILPPLSADPYAYDLSARGPETLACSRFEPGADGILRGKLAGISAGQYRFIFVRPDLSEQDLYRDVRAGSPPLRFQGGGAAALHVAIGGELKTPDLAVMLEYADLEGVDTRRTSRVPGSGELFFEALPPGPVVVKLMEAERSVAQAEASMVVGETREVVLVRGGARALIRVLDGDGEPISSVFVRLWARDPSVAAIHSGLTDDRGEIRFPALSAGGYLAHLTHPTHGVRANLDLAVSEDDELEREFRLDGEAVLELRFADGGTPLPGVQAMLVDALGHVVTEPVASDAEGRVSLPRLAPATYTLDAAGPGLWSRRLDVTAIAGGEVQTIELRALGDLVLRAVSSDGVPVAEAEIALRLLATGEGAADWISAGRVEGPAPLRTDKHGELRLSSVPHGTYSWEIAGQAGTLEVEAGKESLSLVSVP